MKQLDYPIITLNDLKPKVLGRVITEMLERNDKVDKYNNLFLKKVSRKQMKDWLYYGRYEV